MDASPWSPAPSVTYAVIRHTGSTSAGVTVGEDLDGLQYVVDRPEGAYTYQVTAVVNGGEAARSGGGSVTVAAGDADRAPEAVGRLEDLRLLVEDGAVVVDIAGAFRDPDGDALTYEASSSSPSAVAVGLSGAALTITPLTPGAATITVAAPHSGSDVLATQRFLATAVVNGGPEALETLADRVLPLADGAVVVDISEAFRDPDGDALTYAAASSAPAVAAASLSGTALTIVPVALGAATITVTATDVGKSDTSGTQEFLVTVVPNRGPEAVGALADQFLVVSDAAGAVVEASAAFRDPDGDALTYTAVSSSPSVATVSVSGSAVTVVPVALGTATVTVTATDAGASNGSARARLRGDGGDGRPRRRPRRPDRGRLAGAALRRAPRRRRGWRAHRRRGVRVCGRVPGRRRGTAGLRRRLRGLRVDRGPGLRHRRQRRGGRRRRLLERRRRLDAHRQ